MRCTLKEELGLIDVQSWSVCDEACGRDERLWHSSLALLLFLSPTPTPNNFFFFNSVGGLIKEK